MAPCSDTRNELAASASEVLLVSTPETGIVWLQINRPQARNALSSAVYRAIRSALDQAKEDASIRVVVLSGAGKDFAAGSDIGELESHDAASIQVDERESIWQAIAAFPKPLIGAVAGCCFGGGCELAMHCDVLLAADTAKFAQPEINLGLMPGAGGTQRLPRAVGKSLAMQMALTGDPITADRALQAGLISEVLQEDQLLARTFEVARKIASKGPIAVRYTKQSVLGAFNQGLADGLLLERRLFYLLFATADKSEGFSAFREKRKPIFRGG